jgi:muramoyltetrapeptide carboxypeptidase
MDIIKPKALKRGDTIGVVAPAGPVDRERIDRALDRMRKRGFHIKTYGSLYRRIDYLAGFDESRANELMAAFDDSETSAVWCARGGYGSMRILDQIDFDVIRCNPKVFVGFSDITVLHLAIQQEAGLVTFHGPNLQDGFGKEQDMWAGDEAALRRAFMIDEQSPLQKGYDFDLGLWREERFDGPSTRLWTLRPGQAVGRLIGGNLAVLCGMMGTRFEIETAGRILFLEDVNERAYRIDRCLSQLTLAGKLKSAAGVILGSFSYDDSNHGDSKEVVDRVFHKYFDELNIPVLTGFPAGHAESNIMLPMGVVAEVNADDRSVKILESPVSV